MGDNMLAKIAIATAALAAVGSGANGALLITEVMSSANSTGDWFEVTNFDSQPVDITGYKMDDNSFALVSAVSLNGVTAIPGGGIAVFIESAAPATDIAAFRTYWGARATGIAIGTYTGSGVSLSSTADGVELFDATGAEVTRVSFAVATKGKTFGYDPVTPSTFGTLAVDGQNGAYTATGTPSDIGSPGLPSMVPEPGAAALVGLGAVVALRRRRR
jgi:hypothetical protein